MDNARSWRNQPSTEYLAHVWFALVVLMIGAVSWALHKSTSEEFESSREAGHARAVLSALADVDQALSRAESAQRGLLLSGSDAFTVERDSLLAQLRDAGALVGKLSSDDPVQQQRAARLDQLIAERIAIILRNADARRIAGIEIARFNAASLVGQQASARVYGVTAEMRQEELARLDLRRAADERRSAVEQIILISAILAGLIVFLPGYIGFVAQTRARERAERKLLDMAESLPGSVYQRRLKPDGSSRFEFVSKSAARLFGIGREALLRDSKKFWDAVVDEDKPAFVATLEESARTLEPQQHDFRVKRADGPIRWVRSSALLHKEADGSIVWNGYWADVTEQKRLAVALREAKDAADSANRAKSTFLATMSHEIRTPMNGVLGMIELVSLTKLDPEQRSTLEIVRESGKSLLRIIDDILDFSKIEAGKLAIQPEVASIAEIIEAVHNIYRGTASSKGLLVQSSTDARISPALLVDPVRLRQILNNFVSNALKFTPQGGTIELEAELVGRADGADRVRFSVADTGIGIAPQDQERLFRPFAQAESRASRRTGGTGLGLTICRQLAEIMGGSVELTSEPGKGTRITLELSLPIADPAELPRAGLKSARDAASVTTSMRRTAPGVAEAEAEGTLVLLADDHPTNRALLMRQVNALGYAAESAENGVEALDKWGSGRFGLVITDCNMPQMDGYELARSIRKAESASGARRVPIVACTANALGGEAENCFAAGMDDYLVKPVELAALLRKLDQWLPIAGAAPSKVRANPAPAQAPEVTAPVDRSVLAAICGGDAATERDVLMDFRRANDHDAAILRNALASNDISQVKLATHRINGASRMIGAMGLAGVCARIEHASRADDWATVEARMGAFHHEWHRLNAYLDAL